MVDSELPLVGAAASLFAYYSDQSPDSSAPKLRQNIWCLSIYLCALIQIKTPGIFFAIVAVVILVLKRSIRSDKHQLAQVGMVFCISLIPLLLWKKYCSEHFAGLTAKHEGSITSFLRVSSQKPMATISDISFRAVKFFLTSKYMIEFVVVLAVIFCITLIISNESDFLTIGKIWVFLLGVYLLYTLLTVSMFIFSMPLNEALQLSTIDRYQRTILIYCYYVVFCTVLYILSNINLALTHKNEILADTEKRGGSAVVSKNDRFPFLITQVKDRNQSGAEICAMRVLVLLFVCGLLFAGWMIRNNGYFLTMANDYGGTYLQPRIHCETALKNAGVPDRAKCLVLTTADNRVYKAMIAFLLGTDRNDITQTTIESADQLMEAEEVLRRDEWVIVVDTENEIIRTWLEQQNDPHIVVVESSK